MDWLLTVPMLLTEIVLVMKLPAAEASSKCLTLGAAAVMNVEATTKARKGVNPFTEEPCVFKAKPASKTACVGQWLLS